MDKLIVQLKDIVGTENVVNDIKQLNEYNQGTFPHKYQNKLVVLPLNNTEIVSILKTVTDYNKVQKHAKDKVAIYSLSSGKNWGYSSQEPSFHNAISLKLSRIKKIEDFDNKQGTVTISTGVTQQELYDFLQAQGGNFWMDATGSSPHCSIIGNTLERGFGHTIYGDHFDKVCNFEIILADGSIINTGFKQFSKNGISPVAANCYKWGIGPYVDGLFTQSNFGIVTKMTIWLMPKPEHFEAFFISIKHNHDLPTLIDALQPLKLNGIIKSSAHIGNDHKAIQALSLYPWKLSHEKSPLDDKIKDKIKARYLINAWSVSGAFYGTKAEVKVWKKILRKAVKDVTNDVKFINESTLNIALKMKSVLSFVTGIDFNTNIPLLEKIFRLKQGEPTNYFIPSTYWRKRKPPILNNDIDPTKDNVGLLWLAPIAPIDGQHVKIMSDIIQSTQKKYGFEPGLSITLLTERTLDCVISLVYDRDVIGEDEKAITCHDELFEELTNRGYFPYRLSSHAHEAYSKINSSLFSPLRKIKSALDNGQILSPKKYNI